MTAVSDYPQETFKQYVDLLESGGDVPGSSQEQRLCGILMHMQAVRPRP